MLKSLCHYILNLSPGTHGIWLSDGVSQIWHAISTVFANSNLARYYHSFSQIKYGTLFPQFFPQIQIWHAISIFFCKSKSGTLFPQFFANSCFALHAIFTVFPQICVQRCSRRLCKQFSWWGNIQSAQTDTFL